MLRSGWRLAICLVLLLAWSGSLSADTSRDLAAQIEAVIHGPDYRQARWGILVVEAQTGKSVYEHNADKLFIPASTTKLYSCAAALAILGPDYRFETPVYRRGTVKDGRLDGDLILRASGDLTLGGRTDARGRLAFKNNDHIYADFLPSTELTDTDPLAGLKDLAKQTREAGIQEVRGDVLIDDRLFVKSRGSGSGPGLVTPIMVNDNVVDIVITTAAKEGDLAGVRLRPKTSYLQMDAQVVTVAAGKAPRLEIRRVAPQRFTVRGRIALDSKPRIGIYPVEDPAGFARVLFIEALSGEGVRVAASPLGRPRAALPEPESYGKLSRVALYKSPPFSEAVKVTLKVSHNLYASTLPLLVAVKNGKRTLADGLRLERKFLADLGVDVNTISFAGGAGGANADAVTPRATVQLLKALMKRPEWPVFEAGLPVLGVDGTLAGAAPAGSPARGKVRAKTGTLVWHDVMNNRSLLTSKAIAGTMTTADGRSLIFVMFVNNVPLPRSVSTSREGKVLGRLCEIIYRAGG